MRKTMCWLLVVLMAVMVSGCGLMDWIFPEKESQDPPNNGEYTDLPGGNQDTLGEGRPTTLYVADSHGKYVLPVTYNIPWEEGIAKAVVRHLVEGGPAQQFLVTKDLKAVLPAGTTILGMTIKDGLCTVDFSQELLMAADEVHERLILDALVYTLTEFSTVDSVTIWTEGHPLTKMTHGTKVDPVLNRDRGVNAAASAKGTGAMVTIYLRMESMAGGRFLVPVSRPVASAADLAASALEQLIGGPGTAGQGLSAVMPAGTRVLGMSMQGSMAVVNFSNDLAEAEDLDVALAAVVLTLTELSSISSVKMTIGGQAIQLPDGKIMAEPVFRPVSTNPLAY